MPIAVAPLHSNAKPLLNEVQGAIQKSPYLTDRQMRVEALNGVIRLQGSVNSFFQKQMAQELLRRVDGVTRVDNQLQVNW